MKVEDEILTINSIIYPQLKFTSQLKFTLAILPGTF